MEEEKKEGLGMDNGECLEEVGKMKRIIEIFEEDDEKVLKWDNSNKRIMVRIKKNVRGFLRKMRVKKNG